MESLPDFPHLFEKVWEYLKKQEKSEDGEEAMTALRKICEMMYGTDRMWCGRYPVLRV